jgi:hypothetical protein
MTEAIFGLVGVVIGGFVSAGLQVLTRRLDIRDRRRTARRLLWDEFEEAVLVLSTALTSLTWWPRGDLIIDTTEDFRAELAAILGDRERALVRVARSRCLELIKRRELVLRRPEEGAVGVAKGAPFAMELPPIDDAESQAMVRDALSSLTEALKQLRR